MNGFWTRPERLLDVLVLGLSLPTIAIAISLGARGVDPSRDRTLTPASCVALGSPQGRECLPRMAQVAFGGAPQAGESGIRPETSWASGIGAGGSATFWCVPSTATRPMQCSRRDAVE